jgi:hypothetical protein
MWVQVSLPQRARPFGRVGALPRGDIKLDFEKALGYFFLALAQLRNFLYPCFTTSWKEKLNGYVN